VELHWVVLVCGVVVVVVIWRLEIDVILGLSVVLDMRRIVMVFV
jgi:hypothetical protein